MTSMIHTWGTRAPERRLAFPCDQVIPDPDEALYRGVSVRARPAVVFRWLCQLRVAPYSYDWIDNLGRRSPRRLTPGLDDLAVGQDVMRDFRLVDFARDRHLTARIKPDSLARRLFGDVAASYCAVAGDGHSTRLLIKVVIRYPRGIRGRFTRLVLPWGDLIMMRSQLLNIRRLAEQTVGPG